MRPSASANGQQRPEGARTLSSKLRHVAVLRLHDVVRSWTSVRSWHLAEARKRCCLATPDDHGEDVISRSLIYRIRARLLAGAWLQDPVS